jgi:hypothetical protein
MIIDDHKDRESYKEVLSKANAILAKEYERLVVARDAIRVECERLEKITALALANQTERDRLKSNLYQLSAETEAHFEHCCGHCGGDYKVSAEVLATTHDLLKGYKPNRDDEMVVENIRTLDELEKENPQPSRHAQ